MIEERICSYKLSKLLQEKGFDEECTIWYVFEDMTDKINDCIGPQSNSDHYAKDFDCSAPTHQMACDWLQEKHHYIIDVHLDVDGEEATTFVWSIYEKINREGAESYARLYYEDNEPYDIDHKEDAINNALEYVLKNLI